METEKSTFDFDSKLHKFIKLPLSSPTFLQVDKDVPDNVAIEQWEKQWIEQNKLNEPTNIFPR